MSVILEVIILNLVDFVFCVNIFVTNFLNKIISFAGFTCLGTSGEPIKDIMQYSKLERHIDVMKKTLQWRHIAPTCPDSVPSTPCLDSDPFTMYNCPAVYFSGNCNEFATDLYKGMFF